MSEEEKKVCCTEKSFYRFLSWEEKKNSSGRGKAHDKTWVHSLLYYLLAFPKRSKQSSQATEISIITVTFSSQIFQGISQPRVDMVIYCSQKWRGFFKNCLCRDVHEHSHSIKPRYSVSNKVWPSVHDSVSSEPDINWVSWSCKDPSNN